MDPIIGGQIAEGVLNPLFGHLQNVKNRKFTREMYKTQRQDALADWATQNEYNSPRAQMQRLQEAGLNPNLIYGQMSEANPIRQSSSSGGQGSAPQTSGRTFMDIYSMKQLKAQTDLLAKEMSVKDADIELKKMQSLATLAGSELSRTQKEQIIQNMGFQSQLFPVDLTSKQLGVDKQRQDIQLAINEDVRRTITTMTNTQEAAERIASLVKGREKTDKDIEKIDQELKLMKQDGTLKNFDIKWRAAGHNPGDPQVIKIFDEIMSRLGLGKITIDDIKKLNPFYNEKPPGFYKHNVRKYGATDSR